MAEENPNGLVPYFHSYGGRGYEHAHMTGTGGTTTSYGPKPEDMAVGLLDRVQDSLTAADELHTARVARVLRNTYLRIFANGDTSGLAEQLSAAGLGAVIDTSMVDKVGWEEPSPIEPDLGPVTGAVMQDVDQGTFAGVVQGQRMPGVETATEFALMLGAARIGFGVPMQAINRFGAMSLEMAAALAVENEADVNLNGITIKAEEFAAGLDVEVDFLNKDQGELQRERQVGMEEVTRGLRSKRRYWEATGVADATTEKEDVYIDKAEDNDMVTQAVIAAASQMFAAMVQKEKGSPSVPGAGVSGVQGPPQPQPGGLTPSFVGAPEEPRTLEPGRLVPGMV